MAARVLAIRTVSRVASACRRAAKVRSFADHFVLRRGTCEITDGSPPVPPEYLYNRIRVDKPAAKSRSALNTDTG